MSESKVHSVEAKVLQTRTNTVRRSHFLELRVLRPQANLESLLHLVEARVLRRVPYPDAVSASDGMTRIRTLQDGKVKPLRMGDALHGTKIWPMNEPQENWD